MNAIKIEQQSKSHQGKIVNISQDVYGILRAQSKNARLTYFDLTKVEILSKG